MAVDGRPWSPPWNNPAFHPALPSRNPALACPCGEAT
ncbi:hypothetical protein I7I50_10958 [Histoplasma capsulatum G186AR]|uniref:Uncharacterized protein n=1 Tax=Ajellomyces capsulatus TaxID=5037 RepID=A0A8H8D7M7_AJECA|nr:hypothetical protein I7I52_02196 [Histoplasma capsulatum]QSS69608.1 hypothetical protein I7I50_10958 [Histoplasma capsulatum G186AR]